MKQKRERERKRERALFRCDMTVGHTYAKQKTKRQGSTWVNRTGRATLVGPDIPSEKAGGVATQRWVYGNFGRPGEVPGGSSPGLACAI